MSKIAKPHLYTCVVRHNRYFAYLLLPPEVDHNIVLLLFHLSSRACYCTVSYSLILSAPCSYHCGIFRIQLGADKAAHSYGEQKRKKRCSVRAPVSYTHLRAHETRHDLVCRLLLEK